MGNEGGWVGCRDELVEGDLDWGFLGGLGFLFLFSLGVLGLDFEGRDLWGIDVELRREVALEVEI